MKTFWKLQRAEAVTTPLRFTWCFSSLFSRTISCSLEPRKRLKDSSWWQTSPR